ncbi:hypothetical protein [uncultured Azohydromonas sp.]|uniref:hypothetical protein n=1 Tax=uncultured Azohydromonas sp. TaxID=487342 RepID=UPI00261FD59A|nr:hypothetical protein [uncultured Azohydromonas sp.]
MNPSRSAASRWRPIRNALPFSPANRLAVGSAVRAWGVPVAGLREHALDFAQRRPYSTERENAPGRVIDFAAYALLTPSALAPDGVMNLATRAGTGADQANAYRPSFYGGGCMTPPRQRPARTQPVELRVFHQLGTQVLSKTWSHAIQPQ